MAAGRADHTGPLQLYVTGFEDLRNSVQSRFQDQRVWHEFETGPGSPVRPAAGSKWGSGGGLNHQQAAGGGG